MKLLVFASYAQSGVDAGRKDFWAARNGIREWTQLSGRLFSVRTELTVTPYRLKIKPITRCVFFDAVNGVACLEWLQRMGRFAELKLQLQKRIRWFCRLLRKSPRLRIIGVKRIAVRTYSGNQAPDAVMLWRRIQRGTAIW